MGVWVWVSVTHVRLAYTRTAEQPSPGLRWNAGLKAHLDHTVDDDANPTHG